MSVCVIDASVVGKWFITEEDSAQARILRQGHLSEKNVLIAPDLLISETANGLFFSGLFSAAEIKACILTLYELFIDLIAPSAEIILPAVDLIFKYRITIYDALYLSIARRFNIPFITADQRLYKTMGKPAFIKLLSQIKT